MKITPELAEVISDLERCIGCETYNPNSYNGYTGEEGKEYRYPVFYKPTNAQGGNSTKWFIPSSAIDEESVHTIKYRFGSNHLFVGNGILNILEYLQKRYNLDFATMESQDPDKLPYNNADIRLALSDMRQLTEIVENRMPPGKKPSTKVAEWALQKVQELYYEDSEEDG